MKNIFFIPFVCFALIGVTGKSNPLAAETTVDSFAEAKKCSGTFFILTSIGDKEPKLSEYFGTGVKINDDLIRAYYRQNSGEKIPQDVMHLAKEYGIQWAAYFRKKAPEHFPQAVSDCISWTHNVTRFLEGNSANIKSKSDLYDFLLRAPKFRPLSPYPFPDFSPMIPIIETAFLEWAKNGYPSPLKLKDAIENQGETTEKEYNPQKCLLEPESKECEETPLDLAKTSCGDTHYIPGFGLLRSNSEASNISRDELKKYMLEHVPLGFAQATEEYANCVLTIMDYYEPKNGINPNPELATVYTPITKLKKSATDCLDIGLKINTPKFGNCVLKLIKR